MNDVAKEAGRARNTRLLIGAKCLVHISNLLAYSILQNVILEKKIPNKTATVNPHTEIFLDMLFYQCYHSVHEKSIPQKRMC